MRCAKPRLVCSASVSGSTDFGFQGTRRPAPNFQFETLPPVNSGGGAFDLSLRNGSLLFLCHFNTILHSGVTHRHHHGNPFLLTPLKLPHKTSNRSFLSS